MILYGDRVVYKTNLGTVKNVKGSFAAILFDNKKKQVLLPVDALTKIEVV